MDKIIRSFHKNKSSSSNTKNKKLIISENFEKNIQNWKLPVSYNTKIYRSKGFNFKSDYIIKTIEEAIPLKGGCDSFSLLSQNLINIHMKSYRFMHLGMIQVGLKPLTRLGLNTSALILVRDQRHNKFEDSLLGIVESSLCEGPIHFSCFPNFPISLSDPNIMKALTLNIKTEGI